MSYIRRGEGGEYIEIPHGSHAYLYDDGHGIGAWTYEEFAAILDEVSSGIAHSLEEHAKFDSALISEFGGMDHNFVGDLEAPEKGEIYLRVLDENGVEVDGELAHRVQKWVDRQGPYLFECEHCDQETRPLYNKEGPHFCRSNPECNEAFNNHMTKSFREK